MKKIKFDLESPISQMYYCSESSDSSGNYYNAEHVDSMMSRVVDVLDKFASGDSSEGQALDEIKKIIHE